MHPARARPAALGWIAILAVACAPHSTADSRVGLLAETRQLAPCPDRPNCVSSLAPDEDHRIEPFALVGDAASAWPALRDAVAAMPRTRIIEERPGYLHAECTSRIFRFVDDLEVQHQAIDRIEVRSASRVGTRDWGVNRARVEALRGALVEAGVVKSAALPR